MFYLLLVRLNWRRSVIIQGVPVGLQKGNHGMGLSKKKSLTEVWWTRKMVSIKMPFLYSISATDSILAFLHLEVTLGKNSRDNLQ